MQTKGYRYSRAVFDAKPDILLKHHFHSSQFGSSWDLKFEIKKGGRERGNTRKGGGY